MTNERTSKRISSAAAKILANLTVYKTKNNLVLHIDGMPICTAGELKAIAASALTQTPDKPKKGK